MFPAAHLTFLPEPAELFLWGEDAAAIELQTAFDTLIIDSDLRQLTMLWRASLPVSQGLQEVASIDITCSEAWSLQARPRVIPFPSRN